MRLHSLKIFLAFLFVCCYSFLSAQYTIPEKPAVLYPVYDEANLLTQQEKNELNNKLIKFADSTSTEIEIIIIPSTKGEDINFLATMFGEKWGIGQKNVDNGFIFLIAKDDRTMAIQPGRAAEQYLTASVAGQILDYIVTPNFKQGKWFEGINGGTNAIMDSVQGKFKPLNNQKKGDINVSKLIIIGIVIFIILIILFKNRGGGDDDGDIILSRKGRRNYPGGFFPFPFPGSFGGGGFGGGSSRGGGGFGGFGGGGSFGGGGASGGW
ncbi:TPM domain-containing protein [Chryseobacterium formosus]|uniref:TPM domain-containing protein n=1 Tax=Chryseobacterium formosus TaxID=1537363 RepID=A0ABT3XTE4_9FLAO|nr:TPM domain-containing protein [Chryseobacterium formosus]MCX8525062.1 TPM domain-containing protein [Chryseobacterium formosus]